MLVSRTTSFRMMVSNVTFNHTRVFTVPAMNAAKRRVHSETKSYEGKSNHIKQELGNLE